MMGHNICFSDSFNEGSQHMFLRNKKNHLKLSSKIHLIWSSEGDKYLQVSVHMKNPTNILPTFTICTKILLNFPWHFFTLWYQHIFNSLYKRLKDKRLMNTEIYHTNYSISFAKMMESEIYSSTGFTQRLMLNEKCHATILVHVCLV